MWCNDGFRSRACLLLLPLVVACGGGATTTPDTASAADVPVLDGLPQDAPDAGPTGDGIPLDVPTGDDLPSRDTPPDHAPPLDVPLSDDAVPTDFPVADDAPPTDGPVATCENPGSGPVPVPTAPLWPVPNAWSWDGSWTPADSDFPLAGLLDAKYNDGHIVPVNQVSPILPPGRWDWDDAQSDLATWRGFQKDIGTWEQLVDPCGHSYGWRLVPNTPGAVDFGGAAEYFHGSSGADLLFLGANGTLHSIDGDLGDGPDVLVFDRAWLLDYRTGSSKTGSLHDDDLVVAGCTPKTDPAELYGIYSSSIHTGPGSDLVFVRDLRSGAIDAGNGAGGDTSVLDPDDGDDLVIFRGNIKDARFFGGMGNDVAVWYVGEMLEKTTYQGGDFFGGGGWGDALWGDPGTDRLVLVVPPDTPIVDKPATPPGSLLVMTAGDVLKVDEGTKDYFDAKYCIPCGVGPNGERSIIIEYVSADSAIETGYVSVTAMEELQLGLGAGAKVYRLDQVNGHAILDPTLKPIDVPEFPAALCAL